MRMPLLVGHAPTRSMINDCPLLYSRHPFTLFVDLQIHRFTMIFRINVASLVALVAASFVLPTIEAAGCKFRVA
jgi:hypothetical protein